MKIPPFSKLILCSSVALALVACGSDNNYSTPATPTPTPTPTPVVTPPAEPGDVFVLTVSNKLVSFDRATPGTVRTTASVTGLQSNETLVGIDFRPADGRLYGVGSSGRIYTLDPVSGVATLKATLSADAADTSAPFSALAGSDFGVDFNPVADRLRVVSNTGQSLRINVDSGATTTDGALNGGPANAAVSAAAYTNSFVSTTSTTLLVLDPVNATLFTQNPPNNGTLSLPVTLGVTASSVSGFDIDPRTNLGYAVFASGGARNLYTINLGASANAATLVGALGLSEDVRGLALRAQTPVVYGLGDDGRLVSFKPLTPNKLDSNVAISGLATGETLLGIDVRPKDGMLYGMTSAGKVVTIDPATGVASAKATLAADAADTTAPYAGVTGTAFAVDFNPVADRLRVISDTGVNLRINVDTGATTTDATINRVGASPVVSAAAYTNSIPGAAATQLFDIDAMSDSLALQSPPNDGTLVNVGSLGLDVSGDFGMDIGGGANGLALAALRSTAGGPSVLYRIDIATGAATLVNGSANPQTSLVGNGTAGLKDIAIAFK